MKRVIFSVALILALSAAPWAFAQTQPSIKKASPARIADMKAALADMEKGFLKQIFLRPPTNPPVPVPGPSANYIQLLKKKCGIDLLQDLDLLDGSQQAYNAIMLLEIEALHGKGILDTLAKRAEQGAEKDKPEEVQPNITFESGESKARRAAAAGRRAGMKAALADIEKGVLKLKSVPPPASPWYDDYLQLLKTECGIDNVHVKDQTDSDPMSQSIMVGYNAVMLLEIEHRYGQGILGKLGTKAMDDYFKARQGK